MTKRTKRRRPSAQLKRQVRERAFCCCEYCVIPDSHTTQLHSNEHVPPESLGGETTADNLALACQGCNGLKCDYTHARDPVSGKTVRLFNPRRDNWHEHFIWSPDWLTLIGLTSIGRATIALLELNRTGVVNLRRALLREGLHPPAHRTPQK
jgi:HNH endonuclease